MVRLVSAEDVCEHDNARQRPRARFHREGIRKITFDMTGIEQANKDGGFRQRDPLGSSDQCQCPCDFSSGSLRMS